MFSLDYKENAIPSVAELEYLYEQVGWYNYISTDFNLETILQNSDYCISVWDGKKLVGLIRVLSDNYYVALIQDILVDPEYQRQGIGKKLLSMTLEKFSNMKQIILLTDDTTKTKSFYKSLDMTELQDCNCTGFMMLP